MSIQTTMKRYLLCLLASCSLTLVYACAHVPPAAVACVADQALIPVLIDDLRADDWEKRLEALVIDRGLCVVNDTVRSLLGPKVAADPIVVAHAQAWLAAHPEP